MSPVQEIMGHRGKCIFYGSLPQETGGLTPMVYLEVDSNIPDVITSLFQPFLNDGQSIPQAPAMDL